MATKIKEQNTSGNVYNHTYKICVPADRVPDYEISAQKTLSTYVNDIMGVKNDHIIYDPDKVNDADCLCFIFDNNTEKEEVCLYRSNSLIGSNQIEFSSPVSSDGNKVLCLIFSISGNYIGKVDIDLNNGGGEAPANMVTTDTEQTITGAKTFTNSAGVAVGTTPNLAEYKGDSIVHNSEIIKYPSGATNKYFALTDNADGSVSGAEGSSYTMVGDYSITLTREDMTSPDPFSIVCQKIMSWQINSTDAAALDNNPDVVNMNVKIFQDTDSPTTESETITIKFLRNAQQNIQTAISSLYSIVVNLLFPGFLVNITIGKFSENYLIIAVPFQQAIQYDSDRNIITLFGTSNIRYNENIDAIFIGSKMTNPNYVPKNIVVITPYINESHVYASQSVSIGYKAGCFMSASGTSKGQTNGNNSIALGAYTINNIPDSVSFDGINDLLKTPINRYLNIKDPSYILFRNADTIDNVNYEITSTYPNIMYLSDYLGLNLGTYDANSGTLTGVSAYKLNAVNVVYGTFAGETITFTKYGTVNGNLLFTTSVLANGVVHNETLSITPDTLAFTLTDTQIATGTAYDAEIPTDLYGNAETNEISLYHDTKAIANQTPVKLKTINNQSLIGEGNIAITPQAAQIQTLQVDGIDNIPVSSMATVAIQSLTSKNINIISIAPSNESVLISHPWFDGANWKINIYNLSQSSINDLTLNIDFYNI